MTRVCNDPRDCSHTVVGLCTDANDASSVCISPHDLRGQELNSCVSILLSVGQCHMLFRSADCTPYASTIFNQSTVRMQTKLFFVSNVVCNALKLLYEVQMHVHRKSQVNWHLPCTAAKPNGRHTGKVCTAVCMTVMKLNFNTDESEASRYHYLPVS